MAIKIKKLLGTTTVVVFAILTIFLSWMWFVPQVKNDVVIRIKQGSSLYRTARLLKKNGAVSNETSFVLLARLRGDTRAIHAGEYAIKNGMSQNNILSMFVSGEVITYPLTLPEGWSYLQFRDLLKNSKKLKQTLKGVSDKELMKMLGHAGLHPEGSFYPDTYLYTAGDTDFSVLKKSFEKMQNKLAQQWDAREQGLPYQSKYEALIMASIVEKETGQANERPLIAGVFVNRLRKKMRLQTDPTVIYGMGKNFNGNIRIKDLRKDTPYNTYTRYGLPPTPIAMPGEKAIHAALHPDKTEAIFFVARGDGSHVFSKTLKEHNKAVRKYQLKK
jgi:UPF0755 protein